MSIASKVTQITFIQKSGVYMPLIQSNKGDLYQDYQGTEDNPTNIAPDFAQLLPILSFILTSSRSAEGIVTPSKVVWYFNDTELTFNASGISTNTFNGESGHFKQMSPNANSGYYGLQVIKNLVKASMATACTIKAVASVSVGNTSDTIQYVYSIPIQKGSASGKRVTIAAGDDKFFTLRDKNDSCILKAVVRDGNTEITGGITYEWYKLIGGEWSKLSEASQFLTVRNDDVDVVGQFKVEVKQGENLVGLDTQTVTDASDPYDMVLNPVPEDETIREQTDTVVYTPKIVKRGTNITPDDMKEMKFFFTMFDSSNNILNTGENTVASSTCTVEYRHCEQASGNVSLTIMSER